jgi:hypothetical protein
VRKGQGVTPEKPLKARHSRGHDCQPY